MSRFMGVLRKYSELMRIEPPSTDRLGLIDALRGIACMAVVFCHFHGSAFNSVFDAYLPAWMNQAAPMGKLGVQIFFVLSGFSIAYSLRRIHLDLRFVGRFLMRRSIRLDPLYLFCLILSIVIAHLSNAFLTDRIAPVMGLGDFVIHVFYLQGILERTHFFPVTWTLCIEFQFYFLLILLFWCCARCSVSSSAAVFLLGIISLCVAFLPLHMPIPGLIFEYFYMFAFGVLIAHALFLSARWFWFLALAIISACALVLSSADHFSILGGAVALLTSLFIAVAGVAGCLGRWLCHPILIYLGRISYSLYLVHTLLGFRIMNVGYRLTGESLLSAALWTVVALALTLGVSHVLFLLIEQPSMRLAARLKKPLPLSQPVLYAPQS